MFVTDLRLFSSHHNPITIFESTRCELTFAMSGKEAFTDVLAFVIACQVGYSIYSTNTKVECQFVLAQSQALRFVFWSRYRCPPQACDTRF